MRVENLEAIRIKIASEEDILSWSHGEVTKPETINYRTQRAEKDGLFCQKIFGPEKDYQCYCGKYKRIRYKGIVCDRCGVEVTKSSVRRERMGHIKLASPVSHIWFLKGIPSRIGMILDLPKQDLEKVVYFASYIVIDVNETAKKEVLGNIEKEYKIKIKRIKTESTAKKKGKKTLKKTISSKLQELKTARNKAKEEVTSINPSKVLSEAEYRDFSFKYGEIFDAGTGAETLQKICQGINFSKDVKKLKEELKEVSAQNKKKLLRRLKTLQAMKRMKIRPEWMFLTVLPVLPPDLRPMVQLDGGRYASSDLNDLYRRVINRNNRLKYLLEIGAPEVIVRNEKRMLQEAVDSLIDNGMRRGTTTKATTGGRRLLKSLADILKGKQGRFRQNLLGKRVDYSGRSVIVVGPDLKINQVGLPKKMALELFKPFVIKKLLQKELAYNVRGASRLIEEKTDEVWTCLEEEVKDKPILLNRAPTLHRLGVQAFYPILIGGEAIRIHPMVCKAFNADFDGDQMAVHVPLSEMARKEAKERMLSSSNFLKPATGLPVSSLDQDIVLGCYWLTDVWEGLKGEGKVFATKDEAILAHEFNEVDLKAKIKLKTSKKSNNLTETSIGRIIFNEALPAKFAFQNHLITIKDLRKIIGEIIEKYPTEIVEITLDKIKDLGFEYSTLSGITWGMNDLILPKEKGEILEIAQNEEYKIESYFKKGLLTPEEKSGKIIGIWSKAKLDLEKKVRSSLPQRNPIFQMVNAGSKGSWSQIVQMCGMKGLVINPVGEIIELPVKSSYKEGFSVLEYFIATHGARKGTADTALRTSTAGYLTRRLVDVSHEVIVSEPDCKDDTGIEILKEDADQIGQDLMFKIAGKISLENIRGICKKGEIIDKEKAEKIAKSKIERIMVRSPLSCKSVRGVCQKCYGLDLGDNKLVKLGEAVGVIAAQAVGEPGTQLTLRTFHTGGVASAGDITSGLPRVQELFEARIPAGKAELSLADGKVKEITEDKIIKIEVKNQKSKKKATDIVEHKISSQTIVLVEPGQRVKKGQQLCEGSLDIKELFKLTNKEKTWRYIIKEIQKIYFSQGAQINDKHLEVIIRQMFSRVKIKETGNSNFTTGEIVERTVFMEENIRLKELKKIKKDKNIQLAKAVPVLLGISKVALTTESFLSAASFQETSRVLIRASIEGKEDSLRGLKENVIIGKLIPAGTGFQK
ncbi:MAG: DNA-directed RNA polymerase subunit beta' [Candidatus Nealsonbacteria bacterium]